MTTDALITWRFVGVFILGCIFLSYPILVLFNVDILLFGIPLLYMYIFLIWLMLIVLIYFASLRQSAKSGDSFLINDNKD